MEDAGRACRACASRFASSSFRFRSAFRFACSAFRANSALRSSSAFRASSAFRVISASRSASASRSCSSCCWANFCWASCCWASCSFASCCCARFLASAATSAVVAGSATLADWREFSAGATFDAFAGAWGTAACSGCCRLGVVGDSLANCRCVSLTAPGAAGGAARAVVCELGGGAALAATPAPMAPAAIAPAAGAGTDGAAAEGAAATDGAADIAGAVVVAGAGVVASAPSAAAA